MHKINVFIYLNLDTDKTKRCHHLFQSVLHLVQISVKENTSLYVENQMDNNTDLCRAYEYVRKHRKDLLVKKHTDNQIFVNEERVFLNGLVLLAEEEVDKVILAHYGLRFGCGTRALHQHLSKTNV